MKGYKISTPNTVKEVELSTENKELSLLPEEDGNSSLTKVKITKALITLNDVLRYTGDLDTEDFVCGSFGVGVISDKNSKLQGQEVFCKVYLESDVPCNQCHNCCNKEEDKCSDLQSAGIDFDGFLRDFAHFPESRLQVLPDSVSEFQALFLGHISLATSVIEKLNIKKGSYVSIVGANNFGIILAQLLIYHQAVPILLTDDQEQCEIAKKSGIYYVLNADENWTKEVMNITGGRMTESVVYLSECDIPANRAFALAAFNADFAFVGANAKGTTLSFNQAVKKQLIIHCIASGIGNTSTAINLLVNKAVNLSNLKINKIPYSDVPETMQKLAKQYEKDGKIDETVVELV